jgi:hypothetical protein
MVFLSSSGNYNHMKINIEASSTIAEVQQAFHKHFPFLKIEFYRDGHQQGEGSLKDNTLDSHEVLGEVYPHFKSGVLQLSEDMKVSELENSFSNDFNASVQVFHQSGNIWLQTTRTDHLTLAAQNDSAKDKGLRNVEPMVDPMDRSELE